MPVTTEQPQKTAKTGRGWLYGSLSVLGLLLLLATAPLVHPIVFTAGRQVVCIGTRRVLPRVPRGSGPSRNPYFQSDDIPATQAARIDTKGPDGRTYRVEGAAHIRSVFIGDWMGCLIWFEGRRVK